MRVTVELLIFFFIFKSFNNDKPDIINDYVLRKYQANIFSQYEKEFIF